MKAQPKKEKKQPLQKFSSGNVHATVWDKEVTKDDRTFTVYNVDVTKRYSVFNEETQAQEWKETSNFQKSDLPNLKCVVDLAFNFLYSNDVKEETKKKKTIKASQEIEEEDAQE